MNVDYALIGNRIKQARKNRNMTQEKLAERLDVSIGYVSQLERGITKISLDLLAAVSNILDCDISYFVGGANYLSERYLEEELVREFPKLSARDKKLVLQMIDLLKKNEQEEG